LPKLWRRRHGNLVEKLLSIMVIEFLDEAVPPWLRSYA